MSDCVPLSTMLASTKRLLSSSIVPDGVLFLWAEITPTGSAMTDAQLRTSFIQRVEQRTVMDRRRMWLHPRRVDIYIDREAKRVGADVPYIYKAKEEK